MTTAEFRSLLPHVPEPLTDQVVRLQRYVLVSLECSVCREVGTLTWLALNTARAGDLCAAATVLRLAELTLDGPEHDHVAQRPPAPRHRARSKAKKPKVLTAGQVSRWTGTRPLLAATDASWKNGRGGMGFITTDGHWGLSAWQVAPQDPTGPSKILVTELRAVQLLLSTVDPPPGMTILVDSLPALTYLWRWQKGETTALPGGYRDGHLHALSKLVSEQPSLTFKHVKAHSGHLLNEAADSLASIARRHPTPHREAENRAADLVDSFLTSWRQQVSA